MINDEEIFYLKLFTSLDWHYKKWMETSMDSNLYDDIVVWTRAGLVIVNLGQIYFTSIRFTNYVMFQINSL